MIERGKGQLLKLIGGTGKNSVSLPIAAEFLQNVARNDILPLGRESSSIGDRLFEESRHSSS